MTYSTIILVIMHVNVHYIVSSLSILDIQESGHPIPGT